MGNNRLQLNPSKTEWLWVLGSSSSGTMPSLVLDGVVLPQTDPVHNLRVFLDSQLLLNEQIAVVARGGLCTILCHTPVVPVPRLRNTAQCYSCPGHLSVELLQCVLYRAALEEYLETSTVQNAVV